MDLFEVILSIHIGLGMICLLSGAVSMLVPKTKGGHTKWGEVYHGAYAALAATALLVNIGDSIPLLNKLPDLSYWFLPTIIGSPLIYIVARRYRKTSSVFKKIPY
ncbi:hypothetical protein ABE033_07050 [Priestia megaterium]